MKEKLIAQKRERNKQLFSRSCKLENLAGLSLIAGLIASGFVAAAWLSGSFSSKHLTKIGLIGVGTSMFTVGAAAWEEDRTDKEINKIADEIQTLSRSKLWCGNCIHKSNKNLASMLTKPVIPTDKECPNCGTTDKPVLFVEKF